VLSDEIKRVVTILRRAVILGFDCPAHGHRDRVGGGVAPPPPTPPDMRARIRRFVKPCD